MHTRPESGAAAGPAYVSSRFARGSGALPALCVGSSRGRVKPTTTGCVRTRATGLSTD